ncbi:hypothetical protein FGB62_231g011 [Gracilaria domingensis]|nr:hypothetical protein FGB62_231g011 [Gracilaria domingensis]
MDSRIVLSTFSPSVATFMSLLEDPYRDSTPADVFKSLKSAFIQPVHAQAPTHRLLRASDLQQLQRAIMVARSQRRRLKAVTNASSTRAQAALASGAYVLDVSALSRHSQSRNVLTAQCGTPLSHVFAAYEMSTQAPLGRMRSVGGAIASGLLGGCATDSLLADSCVQISLIDSFGRLRVYSASQGGPMFNAIRLSLGAFGVIYDVSFNVDKLRRYVKVRTSFHLHRSLFSRGAAALQRRLRDAVGVEVVRSGVASGSEACSCAQIGALGCVLRGANGGAMAVQARQAAGEGRVRRVSRAAHAGVSARGVRGHGVETGRASADNELAPRGAPHADGPQRAERGERVHGAAARGGLAGAVARVV